MLYECHITMLGDAKEIEPIVEVTGWHFSKIDGDPLLVAGVKCYATINQQDISLEDCILDVQNVAQYFRTQNLNVVRMKVEQIVYDVRS